MQGRIVRPAAAALGLILTVGAYSPALANCVERVVLFEMIGCPHCANTRAFLDGHKIPYTRIESWQSPEVQAFMIKNFGSAEVPVTTNGQKAVRGYTEQGLRKLLCLD
jgi:glutaredoxin